jgi:hypothetical protein
LEDFMKKFLAVCIIGLSLGTASVFADHPDGWGLGIMGRGGYGWGGGGAGLGGFAVSLKAPMLPIYWGLNLEFYNHYFGFGITGDYYLIDALLVPIGGGGLGWYLGVGGYFGFGNWSNKWDGNSYGWTNLGLGVRVPIGIDFVIPVSNISLELFLDIAPSLGLTFYIYNGNYWDYYDGYGGVGLGGGFAAEIGIRIWF